MKIPVIRHIIPEIIVSKITDIQPMTNEVSDVFKFRTQSVPREDKFGDIIHSFIDGWLVYDGKEYLDFVSFIDKYGTEPLHPSGKERLSQWYYNEKVNIR